MARGCVAVVGAGAPGSHRCPLQDDCVFLGVALLYQGEVLELLGIVL